MGLPGPTGATGPTGPTGPAGSGSSATSVAPGGVQSTGSTTDVAMTGVSLNAPADGDYVVLLNVRLSGAATGADQGIISLYINGVKDLTTERWTLLPLNTSMPVSTQLHATGLTMGDTIEARVRTLNGNMITVRQRTMIMMEVN